MHWILQNNFFNAFAFETLIETLERFGLAYSVHKATPFTGKLTDPEIHEIEGPVICMGTYSMRHVVKERDWAPGIFDLGPFDFQAQREKWGRHMLNFDSTVTSLKNAEFPRIPSCSEHPKFEETCQSCQSGHYLNEAFVRPVKDSKAFTGKLFTYQEFNEWKQRVRESTGPPGSLLTKDILVQISAPKMICAEYRFWVVRGEIVCASTYKVGKTVRYSDDVASYLFDFVRNRVGEWEPHEAFVIDVCEISNRSEWDDGEPGQPNTVKIVEINTLNSSAFYACDIPKLVIALEEAFGVNRGIEPEATE